MNKILILNGSHSEIPVIKAAKELGYWVITTGANPDGIGHKMADQYVFADYSDKDKILDIAIKLKINSICSCANDFGAITASYVAEKLNLGGHDSYKTTKILHNKDLFKSIAYKHNLSTPNSISYSDKNSALNDIKSIKFPVIIKPVDLTGGKGISICDDLQSYQEAVKKAFTVSRASRIVAEEFLEGSLHSLTTYVRNKKVVFFFCDNEFSFINKFLVTTSSSPADLKKGQIKKLIHQIDKISEMMDLVDGIFHVQFIKNANGPKIIDITRRCSGDLYPYPVEYSTGINWSKLILKSEANLDNIDIEHSEQKKYCGRHCIMSSGNGIIKNIFFDKAIQPNIYDKVIWSRKGDIVNNFLIQKLGIILLKFETLEEMKYKISKINKLVFVELKK